MNKVLNNYPLMGLIIGIIIGYPLKYYLREHTLLLKNNSILEIFIVFLPTIGLWIGIYIKKKKKAS